MENLWKKLERKNLAFTVKQKEQIELHWELLREWGDIHNLTSLKEPQEVFRSHYEDCILGLQNIPADFWEPDSEIIYDLGSGAGLPGLVAAILWPERNIVLVESSKKKCSFLTLAVFRMGLNRVNVRSVRVEDLRDIHRAFSRAAFSPENLHQVAEAFAPGGRLALFTSCSFESLSLSKAKMCLEQIRQYELEPGNKRQITMGVSRGTLQ